MSTDPALNKSSNSLPLNVWINWKFRDPVSGLSHLFGALIAIPGLYFLLKSALKANSSLHIISALVFGISLILLYTASATYHLYNGSEHTIAVLRRVDHMMIFVLIAGTYTPLCTLALEGLWGKGLLIAIWTLAILGIFLKLFFFNIPRIISTLLYILMGWLAVIALVPLSKSMGIEGIVCLLLGGLFYTVGGIIYAAKWPHIKSKLFGFHEIFHFFILAGSFIHFWMILKYVM